MYLGLVFTRGLNTFLRSSEDKYGFPANGNGGDEFCRRELFDVLVYHIFVDNFNLPSSDDETMLVIVAMVESL